MNRRVLGDCACRGVALTLLALAMPALGDSRGDLNSATPGRDVGGLDPGYSTRSLQGPWIFEALELPGYEYIIFDGNGLTTKNGEALGPRGKRINGNR